MNDFKTVVNRVQTIERLREAAKEHVEVYDLLVCLSACILIDGNGNKEIVGNTGEIAYLQAAIDASDFVEYDKANSIWGAA